MYGINMDHFRSCFRFHIYWRMFRVWNQPSPLFLAAKYSTNRINAVTQYTFVDPNIPKAYLFHLDLRFEFPDVIFVGIYYCFHACYMTFHHTLSDKECKSFIMQFPVASSALSSSHVDQVLSTAP